MGHCVVLLWEEGNLYVYESQATGYFNKNRVMKTEYEEWLRVITSHGYNILHLPLREEIGFDTDKALAWFKKREGLRYGFNNFFFG